MGFRTQDDGHGGLAGPCKHSTHSGHSMIKPVANSAASNFWLSYNANNSPQNMGICEARLGNRNRKKRNRKSRTFGLCFGSVGSACSKTGLRSHLHTLIRSQPVYFQAKQKCYEYRPAGATPSLPSATRLTKPEGSPLGTAQATRPTDCKATRPEKKQEALKALKHLRCTKGCWCSFFAEPVIS